MIKQILLYKDQIVEGLKTFRQLYVRKTDGTPCIKAGDGVTKTEIDGYVIADELEDIKARLDAGGL